MATELQAPPYFETICQATALAGETLAVSLVIASTGGAAVPATTVYVAGQTALAAGVWVLLKQENAYMCTNIIQSMGADTGGGLTGSESVTTAVDAGGDVTGFVTVDAADNTVETQLYGSGWSLDSTAQQNGTQVTVVTNVSYTQNGIGQTLTVSATTDSAPGNPPVLDSLDVQLNGNSVQIPPGGLPQNTDQGTTIYVMPGGVISLPVSDPVGGVLPPTTVDSLGNVLITSSDGTSTTIDGETGDIGDDTGLA